MKCPFHVQIFPVINNLGSICKFEAFFFSSEKVSVEFFVALFLDYMHDMKMIRPLSAKTLKFLFSTAIF